MFTTTIPTIPTPGTNPASPAAPRIGFWPRWMGAFLVFPIGGLAATLAGGMNDPVRALLGGAIVGAVYGFGTWLAARSSTPLNPGWVIASVIGFAGGNALGVALVGGETDQQSILTRALITGLVLGAAQAVSLYTALAARGNAAQRRALLWLPLLALAYPLAWFVTSRVIGQSVQNQFHVFGASGALVFQLLTGLALRWIVVRRG